MNNSLPPLPLIDGCLFIDNSGWVEGLMTCHRSLEYKSLRKRIGAGDKPSLNFGSAIHLALEYRYSVYGNKPVDEAYYNTIAEMFTEFFAQHPVPDGDWRTNNFALEAVRQYNKRYEIEEFQLLKYDTPIDCPQCNGKGIRVSKIIQAVAEPHVAITAKEMQCIWCQGTGKRELMVELPFTIPLFTWQPVNDEGEFYKKCLTPEQRSWFDKYDGIPIIYTGRIDLPKYVDGGVRVSDHKTTGMLGSMFWTEQEMSSQQRGYAWAFSKLTGQKVQKFEINAIRTKSPPEYVLSGKAYKGKSQSPESWWGESFDRQSFYLKPSELQEWEFNTIHLVETFFHHYTKGFMPQSTKWCSSYGRCPYFEVCKLDSQDRGILLASGIFTDNTWSPLNRAEPTQPMQ